MTRLGFVTYRTEKTQKVVLVYNVYISLVQQGEEIEKLNSMKEVINTVMHHVKYLYKERGGKGQESTSRKDAGKKRRP